MIDRSRPSRVIAGSFATLALAFVLAACAGQRGIRKDDAGWTWINCDRTPHPACSSGGYRPVRVMFKDHDIVPPRLGDPYPDKPSRLLFVGPDNKIATVPGRVQASGRFRDDFIAYADPLDSDEWRLANRVTGAEHEIRCPRVQLGDLEAQLAATPKLAYWPRPGQFGKGREQLPPDLFSTDALVVVCELESLGDTKVDSRTWVALQLQKPTGPALAWIEDEPGTPRVLWHTGGYSRWQRRSPRSCARRRASARTATRRTRHVARRRRHRSRRVALGAR